jgi:hypothetical protein
MPIDKEGLSIVQWKAAEMLALGSKVTNKELAKECKVKASTIKAWKKNPKFKIAVIKKFEENMSKLRSKRLGKIGKWLDKLYDQITDQLDAIEPDEYSIKELLSMVTKLHNEVRVDASQFGKSRQLLEMLAEYTGRDPDAIGEEDEEGLDDVEERYIKRRKREQEEAEGKVHDINEKKKKKKKAA